MEKGRVATLGCVCACMHVCDVLFMCGHMCEHVHVHACVFSQADANVCAGPHVSACGSQKLSSGIVPQEPWILRQRLPLAGEPHLPLLTWSWY